MWIELVLILNVSYKKIKTNLILTEIYLSGMSPSLPFTLPFHQSLETCINRMMLSPFFKFNSLSDRALKSNCAVASNDSVSVNR